MAPFSINPPPTTFSNCSKFDFGSFIDLNGDFCLFNTPNTNVADERCGNGVQESNEACDCGDIEECTDQCCNATICQLARGVQCSAGPCCDSQCRFKPSTSQCRARSEECDIEEHCTGASNACPEDIYVVDGTSCASDTGYCAEGKCPTHTAQCMAAWSKFSIGNLLCNGAGICMYVCVYVCMYVCLFVFWGVFFACPSHIPNAASLNLAWDQWVTRMIVD